MKIRCNGWEDGVQYILTSENETEAALLTASINTDSVLLASGEEDNEFILTLPVCND